MAAEILVGNRIEDGNRYVAALRGEGIPITAVFWVKRSEDDEWRLYVASPNAAAGSLGKLYQQCFAAYSKLVDPGFTFQDVKTIHPDHPVARDAIDVRQRYAPSLPIRYEGRHLGDVAIQEAYLYPTVNGSISATDAMQRFVDLLGQPGAIPASVVTFKDGSKIQAIPTSVRAQPGNFEVTLRDVQSGLDRTVSANDVVQIE